MIRSAGTPSARSSAAVAEAQCALTAALGTSRPDLVIAFVAREATAELDELPGLVARHLAPRAFIGCTAAAVVDTGACSATRFPSLTLTAALLTAV